MADQVGRIADLQDIKAVGLDDGTFALATSLASGEVTAEIAPGTAVNADLRIASAAVSATNPVPEVQYGYTGSAYELYYKPFEVTVFASAERTPGTLNSADFTNYNFRGVIVMLDITAVNLGPSLTVTVQGKSGSIYYTLYTNSFGGTSQNVIFVYPGASGAGFSANAPLPRIWRVSTNMTGGGGTTMTYSMTANYVL